MNEEKRLRDLVSQWRSAGREVTEMLFAVIAKPEPSTGGGQDTYSTLWEPDSRSTGTGNSIRQPQEAEKEEIAEDWNYGTMLRALQVDPQLLGWDGETEDWKD